MNVVPLPKKVTPAEGTVSFRQPWRLAEGNPTSSWTVRQTMTWCGDRT